MNTMLMRQSLINRHCLQLIALDYKMPVNKGSEIRAVGTGYHAAWEQFYRTDGEATLPEMLFVARDALQAEVDKATDGFDWDNPPEVAVERMNKLVTHVYEKEKYWDLNEYQVLGVELEFNFPWLTIGDTQWVAHGTIDLVLMGPDGWLYLVDHKTAGSKWRDGKEKPRQTSQPIWYEHWGEQWFEQTYGEHRDSLFHFDVASTSAKTQKVGFERRLAPYTGYQKQVIMEKAEKLARLITEGGPFPPNPTHYLCSHKWCDQWFNCPMGERFNNQ